MELKGVEQGGETADQQSRERARHCLAGIHNRVEWGGSAPPCTTDVGKRNWIGGGHPCWLSIASGGYAQPPEGMELRKEAYGMDEDALVGLGVAP